MLFMTYLYFSISSFVELDLNLELAFIGMTVCPSLTLALLQLSDISIFSLLIAGKNPYFFLRFAGLGDKSKAVLLCKEIELVKNIIL